MGRPKPVVLLILDGWGHRLDGSDNAIAAAHTPNWDHLWSGYPHTLISGSGEDVGLPAGQMGNSEVGHLTMGAGRVIYQDLSLINRSLKDQSFFHNETLKKVFNQAQTERKNIHVMGLLSPGGVHSHEEHLFACLEMAKAHQIPGVFVHAFLDGRDTPPQSALSSLQKLAAVLERTSAKLASICGRYYAMDRDQRWERVKLAYNAIVQGQAPFYARSGIEALQQAYERQETDEFVQPTCILDEHQQAITMTRNDIVIFMNFRADRARALSWALTDKAFSGFARSRFPVIDQLICLTEYDKNLAAKVVFPPQSLNNVLGEYLQNLGLTQLHVAETEKYAHVTFFFNGGIEPPFRGEERILIPSPKVATYDLQPQMSAPEITAVLVDNIRQQKYDFIVCNYANADMVGHTGNFTATKIAIETLDACLGKVMAACAQVGAEILITSDHGNAECMVDPTTSQPHTAHTTSLVPLVYYGQQALRFNANKMGALSDIAPTLLQLMNLPLPPEMTGQPLLQPCL